MFKEDCEVYFAFLAVYHNIKKKTNHVHQASEAPQEIIDEDLADSQQENIYEDRYLEKDEKEYFIRLGEAMNSEDFERYNKNKHLNFLCFGWKKYLQFLDGEAVFLEADVAREVG